MSQFNIHPRARVEFEEAFVNYLGIDPKLAIIRSRQSFDCLDRMIANPWLFNLRRPPSRRANLKPRFAEYYIAYMIWREKVVILAIAHAKRRPYYWRNRIVESRKLF